MLRIMLDRRILVAIGMVASSRNFGKAQWTFILCAGYCALAVHAYSSRHSGCQLQGSLEPYGPFPAASQSSSLEGQ